ncbi:MAG: peptidylprolyl isomerase [Rhizonema sp. PD37]|nr:peptidylprolyl isomerase [Rhizonema sp. PD37]
MSNILTISSKDIIQLSKLSCQIPSLVQAIATQKIITDAASGLGIKVEEEELQQEGDKLRLENNLVKAKDTWMWLRTHHISIDEFEELIRTKILTRKLANYLFAEQVEKFFYEHQLYYIAAVTYEVLLDDRDLALELFYALQEGEVTFQEVARRYIQDPELRRAGGYQGTRRRADFRPEVAAAIFASTPPQMLKPIMTPKGVHLVWVEEIIQPELNDQLRQKITTDLFSAWLDQQMEQVEFVIQLDSDSNTQESNEQRQPAYNAASSSEH